MLSPYGNIFVFFIIGFAFVFFNVTVAKILGPYKPNKEKNSTYECGERPIGPGWINFNARFYLIAILFVIFDIEIVLILPVILKFRDYLVQGRGLIAFIDIFVFVTVLFMGLVYAWKFGYLEWLRGIKKHLKVDGPVTRIKDILAKDMAAGEKK